MKYELDPDGNPRTIPFRAGGGLVVWHSQKEYDLLMKDVDVEAEEVMFDGRESLHDHDCGDA